MQGVQRIGEVMRGQERSLAECERVELLLLPWKKTRTRPVIDDMRNRRDDPVQPVGALIPGDKPRADTRPDNTRLALFSYNNP